MFFWAAFVLVQRGAVELDVVVPYAPQAGQDLGKRSHDQVLAVAEKINKIDSQ
jgi:hypothetical protein